VLEKGNQRLLLARHLSCYSYSQVALDATMHILSSHVKMFYAVLVRKHLENKRYRIPMGQSRMDRPEKLGTK